MTIEEGVLLAPHTTFKIGGPARYFCRARSVSDIAEAAALAEKKNIPLVVLGEGSNVLIADEGLEAVVVKNELSGVEVEATGGDILVEAGAGESWDGLVERAAREGWWGIENLSAIPGTVGATPIQNVGAYGIEVANVIEWVEVFDTKRNETKKLTPAECAFGYRTSMFKQKANAHLVVVRACYRLNTNGTPHRDYKDIRAYFAERDVEEPTLREMRDTVIAIRANKFPDIRTTGTAGSFFKNPVVPNEQFEALKARYGRVPGFPLPSGQVKVSLAWLLDHALGWRGRSEGAVGAYERQPLVLVNTGSATACDVRTFAERITADVYARTNITIEPEVTIM